MPGSWCLYELSTCVEAIYTEVTLEFTSGQDPGVSMRCQPVLKLFIQR